MENCPNCNAALNKASRPANGLASTAVTDFINEYLAEKKEGYCNQCTGNEMKLTLEIYNKELADIYKELVALAATVPVVSSHSPADWKYKTIGFVTGQSTMGAGFLTEIATGFSELFGTQSNTMSEMLRDGEERCLLQLQKRTIEMGGNAILALDIDYNDMGKASLIMVCMTGTAVLLENDAELLDQVTAKRARLLRITQLRKTAYEAGVNASGT